MNQGTQFMSECMQEISRLLSIKLLTSTPYYPIIFYSNKLPMQWKRTLHCGESCGSQRVKMGTKTKTYQVNMLKKYFSRQPDVDRNVVPVNSTDGTTVAVAGVIHQDVHPKLGEVPDLEGYRQKKESVT